jgi:Txe/YoeB family toxin of Txe-Axe toxin-antitoxin module
LARHSIFDLFIGIGRSEHLRLSGYWSRGITGEHRLIYRVAGKPVVLTILSAATTTEGNDD